MAGDVRKFRLLTRSDFDGLVCATLFQELGMLAEIKFVHPKDMQDEKIQVTAQDILTNLPYVPGCHLCFDHHESEELRLHGQDPPNLILDPTAESAARVVYNYYGGASRFPTVNQEMMAAVDRADTADFTRADILDPQGWVLLSFLMDPRTGLGRFHHFRISNYQLMMELIAYCKTHSIDQILALPDVRERVELYRSHQEAQQEQIRRCARVQGKLVIVDFRGEEVIHPGNRFMVYALFPEANISIYVLWGLKRQNTVFAIGKSILNRTSKTDIGALALTYDGGGHAAAGTCQVGNEIAEPTLEELITRITADG